jgi:hypothetical protein
MGARAGNPMASSRTPPAYAVQRQGQNSSGRETFQTVYLTLHQDIVYSISFTSLPADDKAEEAFDVVKGSWAWTS